MPNPHFNDAADETLILLSSARSQLKMMQLRNLDAAIAYVQFFNAAATESVTLGTTTPDLSISIAASAVVTMDIEGAAFESGIVYAVTTTATGNTGPTNGVDLNLVYDLA
jgi:hypothetical protein